MKLRIALAVFLMAGFILGFTGQIQKVSANPGKLAPYNTTPITYFRLSGQVTYLTMGKRQTEFGAVVSALNNVTKQIFTATTNRNGSYYLSVPQANYTLTPSDAFHSQYVPASITIEVNHDLNNLNFAGYPSGTAVPVSLH